MFNSTLGKNLFMLLIMVLIVGLVVAVIVLALKLKNKKNGSSDHPSSSSFSFGKLADPKNPKQLNLSNIASVFHGCTEDSLGNCSYSFGNGYSVIITDAELKSLNVADVHKASNEPIPDPNKPPANNGNNNVPSQPTTDPSAVLAWDVFKQATIDTITAMKSPNLNCLQDKDNKQCVIKLVNWGGQFVVNDLVQYIKTLGPECGSDKNKNVALCQFVNSIRHYGDLIDNFLHSNPSGFSDWSKAWDALNTFIKNFLKDPQSAVNNLSQLGHELFMDLKDGIQPVMTWIAHQITAIGGIGAILKKFEKRIKMDMVQSLIYDKIQKNKDITGGSAGTLLPQGKVTKGADGKVTSPADYIDGARGSGQCTAFPLTWYQNCPDGYYPVGHRLWEPNNDKNGQKDPNFSYGPYACHKWWQFFGGELICANLKPEDIKNIQYGLSQDATNFEKWGAWIEAAVTDADKIERFANSPLGHVLAGVVAKLFAALNAVPGAPAVLKVVTAIVRIAMKTVQIINPESFLWIYADTMDVLYNYYCPTGKCKEPVPLDTLVDRKCDFSTLNNIKWGTFTDTCENNKCTYSGTQCKTDDDCCNTGPRVK